MTSPSKLFLCWLGETLLSTIVSLHLDFNMNDFRVWSLWFASMLLVFIQLIGHKKRLGFSIKDWWKKFKNRFK